MAEKCLGRFVAPVVLSTVGRIVLLVIYVGLLAMMIYGATQVKIHFEIQFFIGKESVAYEWFAANEKHFNVGIAPTNVFIELEGLDISDPEIQ